MLFIETGYLPDPSLMEWKVRFFAAKLCFPHDELNINLPCPGYFADLVTKERICEDLQASWPRSFCPIGDLQKDNLNLCWLLSSSGSKIAKSIALKGIKNSA